jgi:hypothetical protein
MLPDGSGRREQNPGKKTGEENLKKGNLKKGWGKKTQLKKTAYSNRQDQDISITPLGHVYRSIG